MFEYRVSYVNQNSWKICEMMIRRFNLLLFLLLSLNPLGAKTIILPPNYVNGKYVLTQEMLMQNNVKYIIKRHYDLNGATIILPKGAVLVFKNNSSLTNGFIWK